MSLQVFWSLLFNHPAQVLNSLALFFAVAGAWLLLATRFREQRAVAGLVVGSQVELSDEASLLSESTRRLNRFFYVFAGITLLAALLLSWFSTGL